MIQISNIDTHGWEAAVRGMRNPMNSWEKSDSGTCEDIDCVICEHWSDRNIEGGCEYWDESFYHVGRNDCSLMLQLAKAGSDHAKFRRMITVTMDILAPEYWWSEYDTYKVGTVANSCSKMHKMLDKPFEMSDFSFDHLVGHKKEVRQFIPDFDYDKEVWKEIAATGYFVSDMGRIKHGDRILAGSHHSDNYIFTTINGDQIPIHRFVAWAFLPNPNNLPEINHKDGNKKNNSAENLEWVNRSKNQIHAVENHLQPYGLSKYKGKFTESDREEIKRLWNSGEMTRREIAKKYGVSHTCINDIINEKYHYFDRINAFELVARPIVDTLNELRDAWIREADHEKKEIIWKTVLQLLPISYNQRRTVQLNYEVLANIYKSRREHKLDEWREFCATIESLPYSEIITLKEEK